MISLVRLREIKYLVETNNLPSTIGKTRKKYPPLTEKEHTQIANGVEILPRDCAYRDRLCQLISNQEN